jgi:hypothetical protein
MFGDADLPAFFADMGVPVAFGGTTTYQDGAPIKGMLSQYADVFSHAGGPGGFDTEQLILTIPWNAFNPMPKPKDTITVDGVDYIVKAPTKNQDTSLSNYYLKPVAS